jgi:predicted transcriptional regulator
MNSVKDYTEVSVPREVKKKIQILAACQKTSEDKAFEQIIRHGLEAYLAEQTARTDAAINPLPVPSLANKSGI